MTSLIRTRIKELFPLFLSKTSARLPDMKALCVQPSWSPGSLKFLHYVRGLDSLGSRKKTLKPASIISNEPFPLNSRKSPTSPEIIARVLRLLSSAEDRVTAVSDEGNVPYAMTSVDQRTQEIGLSSTHSTQLSFSFWSIRLSIPFFSMLLRL